MGVPEKFDRHWGEKALIALGVAAIGILPFIPLAFAIPRAHDLPDHLAMAAQFREGLAEGRMYPRWFGELNRGWGEPTANYYPPGLYYLTSLTTAIGGGDLAIGLFGALFILSAVGMAGIYRLMRPIAGRPLAFLACLLYAAAPFRAFELYAAGLFSAHAAGCLVPWLLVALRNLAAPPAVSGPREMIARATPLALAFGLIALFNLPCATMIAYLAAAWAVLETAVQKDWRILARVALGGTWGALLAGAFLIPAILELPLVAPPLAGGEDVYRSNFIFQAEGALSPGIRSLLNRMGSLEGLVCVIGAAIIAWPHIRRAAGIERSPGTAVWLRLAATFGALSLFLATPASAWVWASLPFLHQVYFPWRFLDLLALSMAVLGAGGAASLLARGGRTPISLRAGMLGALGLLCAVSLTLSVSIFHMNGSLSREDVEVLPRLFYQRTGYFLPLGAQTPDQLGDQALVMPLTPTLHGKVLEWSSGRRRLQLGSDIPARLALRTYYFPGWTAHTATGIPIEIHAGRTTGRIEMEIPAGKHEVVLSFENTPVRTLGAVVSILAGLGWAAGWILTRRRPVRQDSGASSPPIPGPPVTISNDSCGCGEEDCAPNLVTSHHRKGEA